MKLEGQAACDERSGTDRFAGFGRQIDQTPLLISENQVLVGFKADEWNNLVK